MCTADRAIGKERHFEQVRVLLMSRAARCATCHVSAAKTEWVGAGLNIYGQRLKAIAPGDDLADRMARLEHGPSSGDSGDERSRREKDQDIDGDGVPNWVEILARANPADAENKPTQERIERVKQVVACTICHSQTNLPGEQGIDANPHNAYGALLAETTDNKKDKPATQADRRRSAERVPILKRIELARKKKPKGSKATFWEKLRMMRRPADASDEPSPDGLKSFRKRAAQQRSKRKRDPTRGMDDPAHEHVGFLQDGKNLE